MGFAFKRNERTASLFSIIDRYESAIAAFEAAKIRKEGDSPFERLSDDSQEQVASLSIESTRIVVNEEGLIRTLSVPGLEDKDIVGLHYLPDHLERLLFRPGTLTHIDMERLPRGLKFLDLGFNKFSMVMLKSLPPSFMCLYLGDNRLEEQGVVLKLPLPQNMTLYVPRIDVLNLNGGQRQRIEENCWSIAWEGGTQIKVRTDRK